MIQLDESRGVTKKNLNIARGGKRFQSWMTQTGHYAANIIND